MADSAIFGLNSVPFFLARVGVVVVVKKKMCNALIDMDEQGQSFFW
jgi:hypothetical protein